MGLGKILKYLAFALALSLAILGIVPAQAKDWHRADTHHFTIYSSGEKRQLEDFAHEVEKFDALLRSLWRIPVLDHPQKLTIYMLSSAEEVASLRGEANIAGFYEPTTNGSFAVSNRRQTSDKEDLSGKETLFHEYAHHFMFNNFAIPAPPWFIEGYAEFVATAEFGKNGQWYFGKPAFHRANEFQYLDPMPIEDLLAFGSKDGPKKVGGSFYGWSWALTHMLYFNSGDGGASIVKYLNRINRGQNSLSAARAEFGDLGVLQSRLRSYVKGSIVFKKSDSPIAYRSNIRVTRLSPVDSAVAELTMKRRSNFKREQTRDLLAAIASGADATAEAWYQLALAEKAMARAAAGDDDEADLSRMEVALDRALALDPGHVHANVDKGQLMVDRLAEQGSPDAAQWDAARDFIVRANRADPLDPYALYHFAQSYARQGQRNEQSAIALRAAFEGAPESGEVRIAYAYELASQGAFASAIKILEVLANHPHYRASGQAALDRVLQMQNGGVPVLRIGEVSIKE
ncbi:MAG: hypothetical protein A3J40_05610 [Erythrobacter sp. RIFCSPHIGHO2_12_FULL_63_10]|nr:MAG: hypothetical protein A3J40_05610 [Erythrobacter sp. RIFCSPHIGHO2_12_FULL_63_10]